MSFQLSLTEYSAKYKVSISTLRRRIKKGEVAFAQNAGKYVLPDIPFDDLLANNVAPLTQEVTSRGLSVAPPQENDQPTAATPFLKPLGLNLSFQEKPMQVVATNQPRPVEPPTGALTELKKAYTLVLSEKEEQILHLKQHIVDLQTLNKALENEILRLQKVGQRSLKTSFIKHDF